MPEILFDDIDRKIIDELQNDGSLSNIELARKVNLSPSPCLRRKKRLEAYGVISGYTACIDREKAGVGLTVFVEISVGIHSRKNADEVAEALNQIPEIVTCHMVSGNADFIAEVAVKDLASYQKLLLDKLLVLPMVQDIRSNFSLRTVKEGGAIMTRS